MTQADPDNRIEQLDTLLDCERAALIAGDFARLERLVSEKENLVAQIDVTQAQPGDLPSLREKMARNQDLLTGAMEGIRAVARRLSDLQQARKGTDVYDGKGRKTHLSARVASSVEKRA
ncbi:flagellar biosynthesis protein FlgN [Pukyongiella litopenaei]|uniref:Flagellar biosynthesis protein FlgN n=1 Tax=Pukyongiella litopenaei TaxID=2605946 RepID=A0A2S0MRP2_9RHOB|nr:flagellar biosynthesis protein FlgN [Pukyongiella litopenaei]AVO38555.1 flagellar biosynthesis protein FlgN [Pukyongiella litopenaei]